MRWQSLLVPLFVFLALISPYLFFADSAHFLIHDNLDSNVVWYKILANSGFLFSSSNEIIENTYLGIPRGLFPSEWDVQQLLYLLPKPEWAYALNQILIRLVAFVGVYLLSRRLLDNNRYSALLALCYACIPFWPNGGIGVAGMPFALYCFIRLSKAKKDIWAWIFLFFFILYSNFFFSTFYFLLFVLPLLWIIKGHLKLSEAGRIIVVISVVTILSLLAEYRLFNELLSGNTEIYRGFVQADFPLNWKGVLGQSSNFFLFGEYHYYSGQFPLIILIVIISLVILKNKREINRLFKLITLTLLIALGFELGMYNMMQDFFEAMPSLVQGFSFRFYSLYPLMWCLLLIYSTKWISENWKHRRMETTLQTALWVQVIVLMFNLNGTDHQKTEYAENAFYFTYFDKLNQDHSSFREFYRYADFQEIKQIVSTNEERIACLGLYPEIAQFHGYKTIGGYFPIPPLSNYLKLKRINSSGKMDDSATFGRRGYLHHSEVLDDGVDRMPLEVNANLLKDEKVRFIISSFRLNDDVLQYVESVSDLHIYKLN